MVASALNPAEADLAARTERPKRELGPQHLGMERHLSRDRGAGLVGSDVETAGTERQRFGEHLQRGASLGVKQTLCRFIIGDAAKRQRTARGLRPEKTGRASRRERGGRYV